jgi:pyruvate/2-oxoglutarate dehydrogenase complex dihydrolipoamide dehydrogenase (E3) component
VRLLGVHPLEDAAAPSRWRARPGERAAGVGGARLDWPETRAYRDQMIRNLDDSNQVSGYQKQGATVIKGAGRMTGRAP